MRTPIKKQDPKERVKNFDEVALGYSEEEAIKEAGRCIDCKKASCVGGCPVGIDIPKFIKLIKERKFIDALDSIRQKNNLPAICGRVCPQETQCEAVCVMHNKKEQIAIGRLERFAADYAAENRPEPADNRPQAKNNIKAAIVGSGPAGLTCAAELAKMGFDVTLFESLHKAGGVLIYGIPNFRLPKEILDLELDYVKSLGVNIMTNVLIGRTFTIDDLKADGFKAIFIGTGAGLPYFLGIDGEELNGVYSANEFLTRINLMKAYKFPEYDTPVVVGEKVAVIGAGNVAMDSARTALRLGAKEVTIIYRRSRQEMPARDEEIENAKEEGVKFMLLTNPIKITGRDGWVSSMTCIKNKLGEPDAGGRRRPIPIEGSEFEIAVDTVVCAIGQGPNPLLVSMMPDLKLKKGGAIEIEGRTCRTSIDGVFAGGDIASDAATVISAMGQGKIAARSINEYLRK